MNATKFERDFGFIGWDGCFWFGLGLLFWVFGFLFVCLFFLWLGFFGWKFFFCFSFNSCPVLHYNLENSLVKCLSSVCNFHYQECFLSKCLTLLLFDVEFWCKVFENSPERSTKAGNRCHRSMVFHFDVLPRHFNCKILLFPLSYSSYLQHFLQHGWFSLLSLESSLPFCFLPED